MCPALFRCQNSYSSWRSVIVSIRAIGHCQTMVGSLTPHHIRDYLMSFSLSFFESLLRLGCINVLFLWADLTRSVLSADSIPTDDVLKEVFARAVSPQHSETFEMRPNKDKGTAPKTEPESKLSLCSKLSFLQDKENRKLYQVVSSVPKLQALCILASIQCTMYLY